MKNTTKYSVNAYTKEGGAYTPIMLASSLLSYAEMAGIAQTLLEVCEFADRIEVVDLDTGEIVIDLSACDDDEPSDDDLEMGFNPYLGGYDFDC